MEAYQHTIRIEKEILEKNNIPFNKNDVILENSTVKIVDYFKAKEIILKYEWLKTMPLFNKYFFGIYFNINNIEYLGGVVIYSEEYSANNTTIWNKYNFTKKIILLSRGACLWWTPKNTASYFISKTIKWLKENSDYKIITATTDPAAGEIGTIYQSLNWYYVGLMSGNYNKYNEETKRFSLYVDGTLRHSRSIKKEFGTLKKEIIFNKYPNAIFLSQYRKRRYFYFIGNKQENKEYYESIKHLLLPYPKRNNEIIGVIYLINNKINNKKYVGQTTRGFINRYNEYKSGAKCCNPYILKSIDKYGFENFEFSIIDTAQTLDELNFKEIKYILEYDTTKRNLGYNIEFGGKNSITNPETIEKLIKARKNVIQNDEWIKKRTSKLEKIVIKFDIQNNKIIEEYKSLADAGRNNKDNLSYEQILRKCLGYSKSTHNILWCYKDDYLNNTLKKFKIKLIKNLNDFSENELLNMYKLYKEGNSSVREISNNFSINFSTLDNFIKKQDSIKLIFDQSKKYIVSCKKTDKKFSDYLNKSGILTTHLLNIYPDLKIESKFKRKKIEMETGKPWYYEYFIFQII